MLLKLLYHMKKIKNIKFARFGGLSPVVQEGYDPTMPGFHSPPCRKGIYAFVYPYYEPFLLGGSYSKIGTKHSKFEYVKDKDGNILEYKDGDDWDVNFMKKCFTVEVNGKLIWVKPKKPKIFEYKGEIWHHLGNNVSHSKILQIKGDWFLTDYNTFVEAFMKEYKNFQKTKGELNSEYNLNIPKRGFNNINKDHLEVFIERI